MVCFFPLVSFRKRRCFWAWRIVDMARVYEIRQFRNLTEIEMTRKLRYNRRIKV